MQINEMITNSTKKQKVDKKLQEKLRDLGYLQ